MVKIENECVGCPPEKGCIGSACKYMNVKRYYCDKCKDETDIFYFDDRELCIHCIEEELCKVD